MGWNYLSIPKLQRCNWRIFRIYKLIHPTLYFVIIIHAEIKVNPYWYKGFLGPSNPVYSNSHWNEDTVELMNLFSMKDVRMTPPVQPMRACALYSDAIMSAMASQITSLTIVYTTVYSGADQRKHQSSPSLAFFRGIYRWPGNSPHKWPVTRKMFLFDDVTMRGSYRLHPIVLPFIYI